MDLQNRVALVTGAGVGTGQAIARRLAERGAAVALTDVSDGAETVQRIRTAGGRAAFVVADLTAPGGVSDGHRLRGGHVRWRGRPGEQRRRHPVRPSWVPACGPQRLELALPSLAARGGTVVNIASAAGLGDEPYHSPEYGAAKAGLIRATTCLGALPNVRVNCIAPGWVATPRAMASLKPGEEPPPVSLEALCDAVVELIEDDETNGCVKELR